MKKKIIITGALGYIGTELCKLYSGFSWKYEVIGIDNRFISERVNELKRRKIKFIQADILNINEIKPHIQKGDVVHHLAGITDVAYVEKDSNKQQDEQIKKVAIDYRLLFLDLKYFKNKLPKEAAAAIQKLEKTHGTKLGSFKIMAPSILFRLEKTDDPLLFVPLGNDYYYLVHKWGNDLHPFRKLLMWPFKNIWNLLFAVLGISWVFTEITPMGLFTKSPDASEYWMLLFFMFKAIASVVLYFGFALGKNFNPAIWNNRYNKS